jgi:hypothetical protein
MIETILYIYEKGWVMKFIPYHDKIAVNLYVEIKGVQFTEEILISKDIKSETELSISILRAATRLENRIKTFNQSK